MFGVKVEPLSHNLLSPRLNYYSLSETDQRLGADTVWQLPFLSLVWGFWENNKVGLSVPLPSDCDGSVSPV